MRTRWGNRRIVNVAQFIFYFQVTFSSSLLSPLLKFPKVLQGEQSEMSFRRYHHNSLGDLLHFFPIIITLFLFTYSAVSYFAFVFVLIFFFFFGGGGFFFCFFFFFFFFFFFGGGAFFFSFFVRFCFAIVVYFRLLNEENESNENMYYKKRN